MKTTPLTFVESLTKVSWNHKHSNHQIISTFGGPIFPVQQLSSNLARCWLNSANSTATIISGCVLCLLSETIIDLVENWPAGWRRWFNLVSTFINWSDLRKVQFQNTGGQERNKSTFLERNGLFLQIQWKINIKLLDRMNYGIYADCRNIKRFLLLVVVVWNLFGTFRALLDLSAFARL